MEESKLPVLFFCQSSKDFSIIDELISRNTDYLKPNRRFYIIFVGQKATFNFAKLLYKDAHSVKCLFLHFRSFKKDLLQIKNFFCTNKILKTIQGIKFNRIYFFNTVFDHVSFFLIDKIFYQRLIFIDYFQIYRPPQPPRLKTLFKILIVKTVFRQDVICLEGQILQTKINKRTRIFPISSFISKSLNKNLFPIDSSNQKHALFYDNGDLNQKDGIILNEISHFLFLNTNLKFSIKAHPLHPISSVIAEYKNLSDAIIHVNVPSEFLDLRNIPIGITKTSAALIGKHSIAISILRLQNFYDQLSYTQLNSKDNKIYFPDSIARLKELFIDL